LPLHCRNEARAHAKGGSDALARMHEIADPLTECTPEEEAEVGHLYKRALEQVRGEFEAATWRAFWRTTVDGLAPDHLADELGTSPAAIRQAKSRVLRRLKREVGDLLA
jgi:RNA polymerase sigma-70 factor (ECF subfamily)